MQARQQHVEQAAGPGPIGRRPVAVATLRKRIMRQLGAGQMAEQHAVCMQRAFRLAGGARGVDHHRRIVRRCIDRREVGRRLCQEIGKAAVDGDHAGDVRHLCADLIEFCEALRVGQQRLGAGILQAILQRVRPEQNRDRQRHRAELVDGDVRGGHFRRLRHEDRDAVAAFDALRAQHIGEPVGSLAQVAVADRLAAPVAMHVQNGESAGLARRPAVADVDADIVARRDRPAEIAIERVVVFGV